MELEPFERVVAETVASWPASSGECRRWCSSDRVDAATVITWGAVDDVDVFTASDGAGPVAYGELWVDDDQGEVEIAHVIVRPDVRGTGTGRRFVRALSDRAAMRHPVVSVRVTPDNAAALGCYAAAGFERVDPAAAEAWNAGQPTQYVWMLRRLAEP
jgi:ribosomal protein S18 acetylase RimI-like enzyme